jgi:transcription elongation factor SPT6
VNYRASDTTTKDYFVEDQDLPPSVYAEAYGDPNQEQSSYPDQLLQQARMLIAFELGKDPLLRKDIRERFKEDGVVSVTPTERGLTKIDEHHLFYVSLPLDAPFHALHISLLAI